MARVFTTSFQFQGETYTALVSLAGKSVSVRLMDGSMEVEVPYEEFSSYGAAFTEGEAPNLVSAVLSAIRTCGVALPDEHPSGTERQAL